MFALYNSIFLSMWYRILLLFRILYLSYNLDFSQCKVFLWKSLSCETIYFTVWISEGSCYSQKKKKKSNTLGKIKAELKSSHPLQGPYLAYRHRKHSTRQAAGPRFISIKINRFVTPKPPRYCCLKLFYR